MNLTIRGKIFRGRIIPLNGVILTPDQYKSVGEGCLAGLIHCPSMPFSCSRCKKSDFYICKDANEFVCFCSDDKCLQDDSDASNAIAREERIKKQG